MTPIIIFLLALPILLTILYSKTLNPKLRPPGPPRLPLIGNLHRLDRHSLHTHLHRLSLRYGPVMSLNLGLRPLVVVSSASAVKEIARSHDLAFSNRPSLAAFTKLSYNGLGFAFSPYDEPSKELRKISTVHFFSAQRLQSLYPILIEEASEMVAEISAAAESSAAVDLSEAMMSFVSNVVSRAAFGRRYKKEEKPLFELAHDVEAVLAGFYVGDYFPWLRWIDDFSGAAAKLEKVFRDVDCFSEELIEEHMNPERERSMDGDLIDVLLRMMRDGTTSFDLTIEHIKAIIVSFIIAGNTGTSTALVWAMTTLMSKPSLMKKLQADIRKVAENKDLIDEQDIEKLPYLRAVVKETLRLYPPGPLLLPRETTNKCSINGYEIEGGTMVYINAWAIARDPTKWEDADEFLPERFLGTKTIDVRGQSPEVIPFGFGRRVCPGIGIGMTEIELALANVVYKFDWELPPGSKEEGVDYIARPGLVMHKKNALRLVPKLVI